jgi:hypothetical protein
MTLVLKGLSLFLFAFWPIAAITSIMMFGGPGATNNKDTIRSVILILYYPVLTTGMYWITGTSLFGISGKTLFLGSVVVVTLAIYALGYFRLLGNMIRGINNEGYSVVGSRVFYNARYLPAADAKTFCPAEETAHPLDRANYYLDKHRVYFEGEVVRGIDPSTFKRLRIEGPFGERNDYWGDSASVVYQGNVLEGSDPRDFKILHEGYARSDGNIYHFRKKVDGADAATFEVICHFLAKDKNRIYYGDAAILPEADPATFRLFDPANTNSIAVDKNDVYFIFTESGSRRLDGIDPETLEILDEGTYMKDANAVYYISRGDVCRVPEANPSSFKTVHYSDENPFHATDGVHYWLNGTLIKQQGSAVQ